jgi:hypothetical protein
MAQKPEDNFDAAWDEASGEPGAEVAEQAPDADGGGDAGAPDLAVVIAAAPEGMEQSEAAAEAPAGEEAEEAETPEDVQRRKSWEGRLKKQEEDLATQRSELDAAKAALPAAATGDVAEIVESLNQDFGEDFVAKIIRLIEAKAGDAAGAVRGEVESLAQSIQSALQAMHESAILEAHPDLDDVVGSDAFKQWLDGKDEDKRSSAEAVMARGMWPQIIRLVQYTEGGRPFCRYFGPYMIFLDTQKNWTVTALTDPSARSWERR